MSIRFFICIFFCLFFCSCSSYETKKRVTENNETKNKQSKQLKSLPIDTVDISQLIAHRWYKVIAPDCITYFVFNQDGTYKEDNCEWLLTFEGKYHMSKDSIFLFEYGLDSEVLGKGKIINKNIYTYTYKKDSLLFISNQKIEYGSVISTYFPKDTIYFIREK